MTGKKNAWLTHENHEFLKGLAFVHNSTIEFELNQIVSKSRELEEVKILGN